MNLQRLAVVSCFLVTSGAPAAENGFVPLFDGKTLNGWEIMNGGKFSVKEGAIHLNKGRGWLRSEKEYSDFVLKLEVRFMKPAQDSGIFLRATKEGNNWPKKRYEVQAQNNHRMARLFGAPHKRDEKLVAKVLKAEPGQWNSYEIKAIGNKLEVKLNGTLVTTSEGLKIPKGYIGIQGEGGVLEYRNIQIKEIK